MTPQLLKRERDFLDESLISEQAAINKMEATNEQLKSDFDIVKCGMLELQVKSALKRAPFRTEQRNVLN